VPEGDADISVKYSFSRRVICRLEPLGRRGEVLDVGEEDRELLALGLDDHVALPAEDALVDLRER